jgi:large subunit ribosomal protein L21
MVDQGLSFEFDINGGILYTKQFRILEDIATMYAVIQTGGKQYRVAPGEEVKVEKLPGQVGDTIAFEKVLLASDGEKLNIGKPYLDNIRVVGRITRHDRNKKIVVFKYKKRKGYRRKRGHRQGYSLVKIENIE